MSISKLVKYDIREMNMHFKVKIKEY